MNFNPKLWSEATWLRVPQAPGYMTFLSLGRALDDIMHPRQCSLSKVRIPRADIVTLPARPLTISGVLGAITMAYMTDCVMLYYS